MSESLKQQGDVLVFSVSQDQWPQNLRRVEKENGRLVLAKGEATGHAHTIADPAADLFSNDSGELFLTASGEITVSHEEHKPITLSPGQYKIGIVREVDPFADEVRNVQD